MNPLIIANKASVLVTEAKDAFTYQAWDSICGDARNYIGLAIQGGADFRRYTGGEHKASPEELMTELKVKLLREMEAPCQELYQNTRHALVEMFNSPDACALVKENEELISRIALRNRQIRDLRRQLRK